MFVCSDALKRTRLVGVRFTMKSCPYCKLELSRKTVISRRIDGKNWYQLSSEPLSKYCSFCNNELAIKQVSRWYYAFTSPLYLISILILILLGSELSSMHKLGLSFIWLVGAIFEMKRVNDIEYITLEQKEKDKIQNTIKYANQHFEEPIESGKYCQKYRSFGRANSARPFYGR